MNSRNASHPSGPDNYPADGVFQRVQREAVLALAAPAIALLQIVHPLIAAGIAEHTDWSRDPLTRLRATRSTILRVIFNSIADQPEALANVKRIHDRTRGRLAATVGHFPSGTAYDASDPALLLWGYATILDVGLTAYCRLVGPLTAAERQAFVVGARPFGLAFGIPESTLPESSEQLERYVRSMIEGGDLVVGPHASELANQVLYPPVPIHLRPLLPIIRLVTAGLLPPGPRSALGLAWTPRHAAVFRTLTTALRVIVRITPPRVRYVSEYRAAAHVQRTL